jgi:glycosyltransferase involved in cell wall biosynthesis
MSRPNLSIIMPVYNAGPYVKESIQSIINQTYTDFELIIIDDASTDDSFTNVQAISDSRIRLLQNETNRGIVYTRNRGLHEMKGRYFAPFDADDIAHPDKFRIQIEFMEKHPEFALVGTWAYHIDPGGNRLSTRYKLPGSPESIPVKLLFRAYFIQSSAVFRKEAMPSEGYTSGFDIAEDYKIYFDMAQKYKTWNIPQYLIDYRVHAESSTHREVTLFKYNEKKVYMHIYSHLEIQISDAEFFVLQRIKSDKATKSVHELREVFLFLLQIKKQNDKLKRYPTITLNKELCNRWLKVCRVAELHFTKKWFLALYMPFKLYLENK